ncbi:MAG TPA: extracellular solute-binding protein, partial [Candidatus Binatia bacterium]|nr:extracellular solute-binding protein [Candidatus Binatia bacterium]
MSHLSLREFRKSSIFRLGLAVILMFTFAVACGGGGEEEPTEEALEQPTEVVVEEPTEAPMEEATEAPVEEATEAPMEEATEAPAEEATEAPMEEATEAPMEEATEAPEVNTDVSGSLSILGFSLPDEVATVRVDRFKELYPNVEVNLTEGSLDQQQFLTAVASGNPPDLIYTNREVLSTYATRGALMPLDDCVSNMNVDMSQYRQPAVEQVTVEGTLYGIPEFYNIILVMIDGDVLDEAGLTVDDIDTSDWDQIAAVNEQMTQIEDGQLTRIGFDPKLPEFFPLWVHANGGQLISDDGRTAMLNSPEAVEALEFTAGLHEPAGGRQDFIAFRDTWDFFGGNNM